MSKAWSRSDCSDLWHKSYNENEYKTVVRMTFLLCCENMANVNERRNGNVNNRGGDDVMGNMCEQCGISQT